MAFDRITTHIAEDAPGRFTDLTYFRIGPEAAGTKVYLQAALHADESPGVMLLHHLLPRLKAADAAGALKALFVVVPMANPLGMGQMLFRTHSGRYDFRSGTNFNRRWPDLFAAVKDTVAPRLTQDEGANKITIRQAVLAWIEDQHPVTAMQTLRLAVMREAHDADYVFDLHCDDEALPHIFITPDSMEGMQDLADWMGSVAQLTAEDSGGGSFDEVWPFLWTEMRRAFPDKPIPFAARAATLEYRGQPDVFDEIGAHDADNLFCFFQGRGLIAGTPSRAPDPAPAPQPLSATEMLRVDRPGLLAYRVELGAEVEKGQPVADLIALDGDDAFLGRTPICAGTRGRVISRNQHKYVSPGASIAKIVGSEPIPGRDGYLLED